MRSPERDRLRPKSRAGKQRAGQIGEEWQVRSEAGEVRGQASTEKLS